MTLGKRIKSERLRAKLTQDELAGYLGVTYQAVSQWERDENRPDQDRLPHLARLLDSDIEYLLTGHKRNNVAQVPAGAAPVRFKGRQGKRRAIDRGATGGPPNGRLRLNPGGDGGGSR